MPCADHPPARDHDDRVAERRDLLHDVAREQHAAALGPQPADDFAHRRVLITSSPLVGSSSSTLRGSWTSARASATLVRSPCEKPPRAAIGDRRPCRAVSSSSRVRCASAPAGQPLQLAVVVDVLARRQSRIEARDVGQHAQPRLRPLRIAPRHRRRPPRSARVRPHQRVEHPQRRRLAGAVRSEQAGDGAIAATKLTSSTAVTAPNCLRDSSTRIDWDGSTSIIAQASDARVEGSGLPATERTAAA